MGSPSLLIDGQDPFAPPAAPTGLACRIYSTPDGPSGSPTVDEANRDPTCWCCGRRYPEERLVRLGTHPEAGVCFQCAKVLHRRACEQNDVVRGDYGLTARGRVAVQTGRDFVIRHGWQHGRIAGPVLRRIDKFMP